MLPRILAMACLVAALAGCERVQEPDARAVVAEPVRPTSDARAISAAPEHFDRVRAEQFEKEEDRLRKRARN